MSKTALKLQLLNTTFKLGPSLGSYCHQKRMPIFLGLTTTYNIRLYMGATSETSLNTCIRDTCTLSAVVSTKL